MKAQNTFKPTRGTSRYGNALDAFYLSTGIIMFAGLIAMFSYKLAIFVILYFITWVACMIRFKQSNNNQITK